MLGKAVESALVLPLLARGKPHPYPKWQSWWLAQRHARGEEIVQLCYSLLGRDQPGRDLGPSGGSLTTCSSRPGMARALCGTSGGGSRAPQRQVDGPSAVAR